MNRQPAVTAEISLQNEPDCKYLQGNLGPSVKVESFKLIGPLILRIETASEWDFADFLHWLRARHVERAISGDVEVNRRSPAITIRLDRELNDILRNQQIASNLSVQRDLGQFAHELIAARK